jgi:hypothetical protein
MVESDGDIATLVLSCPAPETSTGASIEIIAASAIFVAVDRFISVKFVLLRCQRLLEESVKNQGQTGRYALMQK